MEPERTDAEWMTEDHRLSLAELADLSGLPETELRELIDYGCIAPVDPDSSQWVFTGKCLWTVRTASRIRVSFDLEPHGTALVVSLLDRINDLEAQLNTLRAQMPRRIR